MSPALVAVLLAAAPLPSGRTLSVDPAASAVHFHVNHKLHGVDGRSGTVEGKVVLANDGNVLAMVRIPAATFDSGDANRDLNMRQAIEASRYPYVVLKGVAHVALPVPIGRTFEVRLDGEVEFHGVRQRVVVPVAVTFSDASTADVRASFPLSLDSYRVERPSLLFVKLDDACAIDVALKLRASP